ncbi:MAG: SAM-dependent methyltransferase, partial [bacterium]
FIKTIDFIPYFWNEKNGESKSEDYKIYYFDSEYYSKAAICILNSTLFYWYWRLCFDGYHCGKDNISSFHCNLSDFENNNLHLSAKQLIDDFKLNSVRKTVFYKKTGKTIYDEFELKKSKPIIDQIDTVLAQHYGFTGEELDFIINYDIKYRMGKALFGEENGEEED